MDREYAKLLPETNSWQRSRSMVSVGTAWLKITSVFRGGPIRWLVLGGTLLIVAIAIGATVMAGNFRERALRNSERELENTVLLLARHFDQQLEDFEVVQKDLISLIHSSGISTSDDYKRWMSTQNIHLMLKSKMDALAYVGGINVFDANGTLINSSAAWPVPTVSVADRAYFKTFKSGPDSPSVVIEPVYSRVTGAWTIVIARKVTGPNGEFLGAIGRGIEPANFETFFASVALGPEAAIAMHHRDGTLLARYPHLDELIGKNFRTGPASQQQVFEQAQTTSRLTSPLDGKDRLISSRALSKFPIVEWINHNISTNRLEHRGCLHAVVEWPRRRGRLHCICVHLGLTSRGRKAQLHRICGLIASTVPQDEPMIVAGDFNVFWGGHELYLFTQAAGLTSANLRGLPSYPSRGPRMELDFILHSAQIRVDHFEIPDIRLSDHLPLICDFSVNLPTKTG